MHCCQTDHCSDLAGKCCNHLTAEDSNYTRHNRRQRIQVIRQELYTVAHTFDNGLHLDGRTCKFLDVVSSQCPALCKGWHSTTEFRFDSTSSLGDSIDDHVSGQFAVVRHLAQASSTNAQTVCNHLAKTWSLFHY